MFPTRWASALTLVLMLSSLQGVSQDVAEARFNDLQRNGSQAFRERRLDDAAKLYRQAVKLRPAWAEGWGYLAASLFSLNRFAEAKEAYRQTTVLTPKNGPSWAYLGFCEFELRDYRNAFDHLIRGQRLGLGDDRNFLTRVHYDLALLWDTAGQFDMAEKEIALLANAGDKSPPVIEAYGLIVLRMPVFPYEIPASKHELVMKVGEAGWAVGARQVEEARQKYKDLVAENPHEPNLHYAYGMTLTLSDQDAAIAELEKEVEISPRHVPAMIEIAFLSLQGGDLEKSEKYARRAMQIEPKNYAPHNLLGGILVKRGQPQQGIPELELAVKLAPSIAAAHLNLAQAYQKVGRKAAADREFAAFRELDQSKEGTGAEAQP